MIEPYHPSAESIIALYERFAPHWDRDRGRSLFEKRWLNQFLAVMPRDGDILDIGCGSAEPIARYLIEAGRVVAGLDSSASLIAMARMRFPDHDWIVGDMRELRLQRKFSGLIAWDSFFHLCPEDQRRMFPVFQAHAADGAALLFTSGPRYGEAIGTLQGEPLYHASLDPGEYRALLALHGFEVLQHTLDDADCGGHTICLAKRR